MMSVQAQNVMAELWRADLSRAVAEIGMPKVLEQLAHIARLNAEACITLGEPAARQRAWTQNSAMLGQLAAKLPRIPDTGV